MLSPRLPSTPDRNFYGIQLIEVLRGGSPLLASAQFTPSVLSGLAATLTMAYLHSRVPGQVILALAMAAFCVGNLLLAICPLDSSYWTYIFFSLLVTPFGMDMSYPAASLIVSDALPTSRQGVGASMINTVVNLSVSLGLGIAGTVQVHVDRGGTDVLRGQRGAGYVGIGLSGLGIAVALLLCRVPRGKGKGEGKEKAGGKEAAETPEQVRPSSPEEEREEAVGKDSLSPSNVEMDRSPAEEVKMDMPQVNGHTGSVMAPAESPAAPYSQGKQAAAGGGSEKPQMSPPLEAPS